MDVAYTQAEAIEMANHDSCMDEGGPPYVPPAIETVSDPSVDIGLAFFAGGALLQLACRVRAHIIKTSIYFLNLLKLAQA
jgi:hypothetical protein